MFGRKKSVLPDPSLFPKHIAVIMDGNGRWATRRALPRSAGHSAGSENFRKISRYCRDIGIERLTVYAFSTENFKRPADEVEALMALMSRYLDEAIADLAHENVRLGFIGQREGLSAELLEKMDRVGDISKGCDGISVNIALNYGGRDELVSAARSLAKKAAAGEIVPEDITEDTLSSELFTAGQHDPDLVIRTGAEKRLSNFLLWQSAYAELYFTDTLWPDFSTGELDRAIAWFSTRKRRFGDVK